MLQTLQHIRVSVVLILVVLISTSVLGQDSTYRVPYLQGELWGYSDAGGELVIDAVYNEVSAFRDGKALVARHGKWGMINLKGEQIVPCQYNILGDISEYNNLWYSKGSWFNENDHIMATNEKGTHYLTPEGEYLDSVTCYSLYDTIGYVFNEDICFRTPEYEMFFAEVKGTKPFMEEFNCGLICYSTKEGKGYINDKGEVAIPMIYDDAGSFSNGVAMVRKDRNWAYILEDGRLVSDFTYGKPGYNWTAYFKDSLLLLKESGKWGFLDVTTGLKVESAYDAIVVDTGKAVSGRLQFLEVWNNKKCGLITRTGEVLVPLEFDHITYIDGIKDSLILTELDGKYGVYKLGAGVHVPAEYDNIQFLSRIMDKTFPYYGYMIVKKGAWWGVLSPDQQIVVPFEYNHVEAVWSVDVHKKKGFLVSKDNKYGFTNLAGELIVRPKYGLLYPTKKGFVAVDKTHTQQIVLNKKGKEKGNWEPYTVADLTEPANVELLQRSRNSSGWYFNYHTQAIRLYNQDSTACIENVVWHDEIRKVIHGEPGRVQFPKKEHLAKAVKRYESIPVDDRYYSDGAVFGDAVYEKDSVSREIYRVRVAFEYDDERYFTETFWFKNDSLAKYELHDSYNFAEGDVQQYYTIFYLGDTAVFAEQSWEEYTYRSGFDSDEEYEEYMSGGDGRFDQEDEIPVCNQYVSIEGLKHLPDKVEQAQRLLEVMKANAGGKELNPALPLDITFQYLQPVMDYLDW